MTREQAIDAAIVSVCKGLLDDYGRGLLEEDKLRERIRRRLPGIAACMRELLGGERVVNCRCGQPATTRIAGADYCEVHAAGVQRLTVAR